MDWSLCVICSEGGPALKCPANSKASNGAEVYGIFLENVSAFEDLDTLPGKVDFKQYGSVQQFMENQAKWHKACHLERNIGEESVIKDLETNLI